MPGFGHLMTGGMLAVTLFVMLRDKGFTRKHAMYFTLNSYVGPDLANAYFSGVAKSAIHSPWGFAIFLAPLLSVVYWYLSRFTLRLTKPAIEDDGRPQIPWVKCYLLVAAGGIWHFTVDILFEGKTLWPGVRLDGDTLIAYFNFSRDISNGLLLIGAILLVSFPLVLSWALQKGETNRGRLVPFFVILGYFALVIVFYTWLGNEVGSGENDLGASWFVAAFFILPLIMCYQAREIPATDVPPVSGLSPSEVKKETRFLGALVVWQFVLGVVLVVLGVLGVMDPAPFVDLLRAPEMATGLTIVVYIVGILFLLIGSLSIWTAIGLQRRLGRARETTVALNCLLAPLIFPLIVGCYAAKREVKWVFQDAANKSQAVPPREETMVE